MKMKTSIVILTAITISAGIFYQFRSTNDVVTAPKNGVISPEAKATQIERAYAAYRDRGARRVAILERSGANPDLIAKAKRYYDNEKASGKLLSKEDWVERETKAQEEIDLKVQNKLAEIKNRFEEMKSRMNTSDFANLSDDEKSALIKKHLGANLKQPSILSEIITSK